jgi:hypothetical protein
VFDFNDSEVNSLDNLVEVNDVLDLPEGYLRTDTNLDGKVDASDYNIVTPNSVNLLNSQLP